MTIEEARMVMKSRRLKLEDVNQIPDDFLPTDIAANVIGVERSRFIEYAKTGQLQFDVLVSGNRVKVPRIAFLKHYGVTVNEHEPDKNTNQILKELHNVNVALTVLNAMVMCMMKKLAPDEYQMMNNAFAEGGNAQ